jgi:hypothetical protein
MQVHLLSGGVGSCAGEHHALGAADGNCLHKRINAWVCGCHLENRMWTWDIAGDQSKGSMGRGKGHDQRIMGNTQREERC